MGAECCGLGASTARNMTGDDFQPNGVARHRRRAGRQQRQTFGVFQLEHDARPSLFLALVPLRDRHPFGHACTPVEASALILLQLDQMDIVRIEL